MDAQSLAMVKAYDASSTQHSIMFLFVAVILLVAVIIGGAVLKRMNFSSTAVDHEMERVRLAAQRERLQHERELAQAQREHASELAALRAEMQAFFSGDLDQSQSHPGFGYDSFTIDPVTTMGHPTNPKNRQLSQSPAGKRRQNGSNRPSGRNHR